MSVGVMRVIEDVGGVIEGVGGVIEDVGCVITGVVVGHVAFTGR